MKLGSLQIRINKYRRRQVQTLYLHIFISMIIVKHTIYSYLCKKIGVINGVKTFFWSSVLLKF